MIFRRISRAASLGRTAPRVSLALAGLAVLGLAAPAPTLADEETDKTLYFIGMSIARSLGTLHLSEAEVATVVDGITETTAGEGQQLDPELYSQKVREFQQARAEIGLKIEGEKSAEYLEKKAAEKGAKIMPSGLIITHTDEGDGAMPKPTDKVRVNYKGMLRDGSVFDRSAEGQPAEFPLNGVIPCWTEGLGLMKVGGKAELVCPAEIAYKAQGMPPVIPPGAALTFEVELLGIVE